MLAEATTDFLQPDWQAIHCYPGGWPFGAFFSELLARPGAGASIRCCEPETVSQSHLG